MGHTRGDISDAAILAAKAGRKMPGARSRKKGGSGTGGSCATDDDLEAGTFEVDSAALASAALASAASATSATALASAASATSATGDLEAGIAVVGEVSQSSNGVVPFVTTSIAFA